MKSKSLICFILFCALLVTAVLPVSGEDSAPMPAAWDGSADTSWYNTTDNTFTLTDAADLAGFAAIVNGTAEGIAQSNFLGKTVKLGADILLNTGDAASWTPETEGLQAFPIIGNISEKDGAADASLQFSGEFDGQGHTISGLYVNGRSDWWEGSGLFAAIYGPAKLHDFALVNSAVFQPGRYNAAAVTAYAFVKSGEEKDAFSIYNIYTDAMITASGEKTGIGGIVGKISDPTYKSVTNAYGSIRSCVFAGKITQTGNCAAYSGGILGNVNDVGVQISDCLNLGTIVSLNNREYLGGIVGKGDTNHCTIRINRCVSVVDPTSASRKVGGIISFGNKPIDDDEFLDCFTAGERYAVCKEGNEATGDSIRTGKTTLRELVGADVPEAVKTALTGWVTRDGGIIIPAGVAALTPLFGDVPTPPSGENTTETPTEKPTDAPTNPNNPPTGEKPAQDSSTQERSAGTAAEKPAEKGCQSAVGIAPLLALILSGIYVAENKKRNR